MARSYQIKKSSELKQGDVVHCHGMDCLIDREINSRDYASGRGPTPVFFTSAKVLNRDEVPNQHVPYAFTDARDGSGEHRWTIQGNDLACWHVVEQQDSGIDMSKV